MKRLISFILCMILMSNICYADVSKYIKDEDTILLKSQIFSPVSKETKDTLHFELKGEDNEIYGPVYDYGDIKIDDYLQGASGITDVANKSFINFETFRYASIKLFSKIPGIGDIFTTGEDIYDALVAVYDDLTSIDKSKQIKTVRTAYSYRYFYHYLYAYDYNDAWKSVGRSLSKYYYKHLTMQYYNADKGDYELVTQNFTHSEGYGPEVIAEAPNYMDYSTLASLAYEAWLNNTTYNEQY